MTQEIIKALAKALPELESAKKNADNPHLKSKYANLSAIMAAVEPIAKHGLWYRQKAHDHSEGACIETIYLHESGEELSAGITFVRAEKQNPQGFGSAMTYARRYSLQSAFGLDAEDDDGHAASQKPAKAEPAPAEMPDHEWARLVQLMQTTNTGARTLAKGAQIVVPSNNLRLLDQDAYARAIEWLTDRLATMAKEETDTKAKDA